MRASLQPLLLIALAGNVSALNCAADNCLRALRATQTPGRLEDSRAFCSTYLAATQTAAPSIPTYVSNACKANQNGDSPKRISSACACIAPTGTTSTSAVPTATEPCAQVSSLWAAQVQQTATPEIPVTVAYQCLNSVPLHKKEAIELVESIEPYLEWQSDAAYKADPPADYPFPAYDMFAALAEVKANLQNDKYKNEYTFQLDLFEKVSEPGHDGHFGFYPEMLRNVIRWRKAEPLVSVSEDGTSLPVIKLYKDVISGRQDAPVVKLINNVDASKFARQLIDKSTASQDLDAAYNQGFYSAASQPSAVLGTLYAGGTASFIYPGLTTTFSLSNGTTLVLDNKARVYANMTGVVDGPSFYKKFCTPPKSGEMPAGSGAAAPTSLLKNGALPGYPMPVTASPEGAVTGYYLEGEGFEHVAVLALQSFEPDQTDLMGFATAIRNFLHAAKAAGKTKLVVDVQRNGGGYITLGYNLFLQLFPDVIPDGFSRWKENDGYLAIARAYSAQAENTDSYFDYRADLNLTNKPFQTFEDKFAPHVYKKTPYTAILRNDLRTDFYPFPDDLPNAYSTTKRAQPFAAQDIIILYDGYCASTCTLFSEMMRLQGNVKSVAFGGRPQAGPIQGVGGIKGSQVLTFDSIYFFATQALSVSSNDSAAVAALSRYTTLPILRSGYAAANVRDQILRPNVRDGLPAQYVVENADCRLYWTEPMMRDIRTVWKAAAAAAFNGAKCVNGGLPAAKGASRQRPTADAAAGASAAAAPPSKMDPSMLHVLQSKEWRMMQLQKVRP